MQQPEVSPEVMMGDMQTQVFVLTNGTMGTSPLILNLHMEPRKRPFHTYIFTIEHHLVELRIL